MKPDSILVVVWWLWFVPALMVLPLPLQWYFALVTRGLESVLSSGIGGDEFAILELTAVPFIFGFLPLVFLSLLYGFVFWRHRERGIALTARFRVPLYGTGLLAVMLALMVLVVLSARREYWTPPPSGLNVERHGGSSCGLTGAAAGRSTGRIVVGNAVGGSSSTLVGRMHAYFKTEKFRQELDDDELGTVVLGEDCIEWLTSQLDGRERLSTERPIYEDWGWTMALSVDGIRLWLNVQDWSFEEAQTWHLWVEPRGLVARLAVSRYRAARTRIQGVLDGVLSDDAAIRDVRWSEQGPGERPPTA